MSLEGKNKEPTKYKIDIKEHARNEIIHDVSLVKHFVQKGDTNMVKYTKERITKKLEILLIQ